MGSGLSSPGGPALAGRPGDRPSPGMTSISDLPTASSAGVKEGVGIIRMCQYYMRYKQQYVALRGGAIRPLGITIPRAVLVRADEVIE